MKIEKNVLLKNKTTFGIGGICKNYLIPETIEELTDTYKKNPTAHLLAGGSNIIVSDLREFEAVISLLKFDTNITDLGNGTYEVGASVRNQILIKRINSDGYGGIEYLHSVPGTIGGAIYMNAGTGKELSNYISDNIVSVKWFDGEEIKDLSFEDCEFSYRHSCFQEKQGVIISAVLKFDPQSMDVSKRLIAERTDRVKKRQDHSGKSCGTLCKIANKNVMRILKLLHYGNNKGVHFSSKTPNWLINSGDGTYSQFVKCINLAKILHRIIGKNLSLEVEVWE